MLVTLHIENIAVIEYADISFGPGLNILTGETGAGKSIVIDSINAVMGERVSRDVVRTGAKTARVSALFDAVGPAVARILEENGFSCEEDGTLLLQREINAEGKTVCRIGGRLTTVSILREVGRTLLNIHGQHENQALLSPQKHMGYLDSLGGYPDLLAKYHSVYDRLCRIKKELAATDMDEALKARRIDLLRYQIQELEEAGLRPGELGELEEQRTVYLNSERIATSILSARAAIGGDEENEGASQRISDAATALQDAARYYPHLQPLAERMQAMVYDLDDANEELREVGEQLEYDPRQLDAIENRIDYLHRLARKYGNSEEEMLQFLDNASRELSQIELSDERAAKLSKELEQVQAQAVELAGELTVKRMEAAKKFEDRVRRELSFLDMPGVRLQTAFTPCPLYANGAQTVEFLLSVNPGEPPKPISKIASGGELSRIMLSIQNVLADQDEIGTLIFDEVDTGISGRASQKVGLKLKQVSKGRQILCVTHSAQIAAFADRHLLIEKHVRGDRTFTDVRTLDEDGQKREIARIIGGETITQLTLQNASEMLRLAQEASNREKVK